MPEWMGNPWYPILLGALVCGVFLWIYRGRDIGNNKTWVRLDLSVVLIGGIAVLLTVFSVQKETANWELEILKPQARGHKVSIDTVLRGVRNYACILGRRSSMTPDNFDEIQAERASVCDWAKLTYEKFLKIKFSNFPEIDLKKNYPKVTFLPLIDDRERIAEAAERYQSARANYLGKITDNQGTLYYRLALVFSPYLLCVAFGLALCKSLLLFRHT